jgi:hypothetical protein
VKDMIEEDFVADEDTEGESNKGHRSHCSIEVVGKDKVDSVVRGGILEDTVRIAVDLEIEQSKIDFGKVDTEAIAE